MKIIYTLILVTFWIGKILSQSNECVTAITLTTSVNCSSPVNGSTAGFTQSASIPVCTGFPDDDGWYKFVATSTSHSITITGSATFDAVLQVFSGSCGALTSIACIDNTLDGEPEEANLTGLTIGNTYFIRIYDYYVGSGSSTFTICVTNPPPAPTNDFCANAINLTVNVGCTNTVGTTLGATQTMAACTGNANDDVWYKFTANSYTQTINIASSTNFDGVVQLLDGACVVFNSLNCVDNTGLGGSETINAVGLTVGQVYFIRVYEYGSGAGGSFSICVSGNPAGGGQPNDDPCGAIQLPAVTSACNYLTFSTIGATSSTTAPIPFSCTGGSGASGGYVAGTSKDVWFKITVPPSGIISITPKPNQGAGWLTDPSMALYSGACGSLTQIACSRDYTSYPGSGDDLLPFYVTPTTTPLPAGSTVYLRYWADNSVSTGSFAICIQSPTNDECANALYVCDINGYSGSTSEAYSPDRPGTGTGQMYGNNENAAGTNLVDGVNSCGPFGFYPACPATASGPYSSPKLDVNIENNSWIRFTAGLTTANLRVTIGDCFVGTYTLGGIQMQIFSSTGCNNFIPVSSFKENSTTFTVTANGLTVGNDYYLMVDGYRSDVCNYTIQALDGVAFPAIIATPTAVCAGNTSTLTAPSASSYSWSPGGATTQTIVVTPDKPISTYTCIVSGVCGQKQTLTKSVVMNALPTVSINAAAAITTCGTQTITLTGGGASTYSWSSGSSASSFTVAPSSNVTYSVVGTSVNGCTSTAISNVTVNTVPTIIPAGTNTICNGSSTTLTVSGANTYVWSPSVSLSASTGTVVTASPTTTTNYTVIGTAANGCTNSAIYTVTVSSKPTVSSTTTGSVICNGNSITLNGTGASSYTWTGGVTNGVAFTPTITTTYTVNGTNATTGCTNTAIRTITVNPLPIVSSTTSNSVICNGSSTILNGTGATSYSWTGGVSNGVSFSPTTTVTYTVTGTDGNNCVNTSIRTITVNPIPTSTLSTSGTITCVTNTVNLNSSLSGQSYTWTAPSGSSISGGTTNNQNAVGQGVGTYTLKVLSSAGCIYTTTLAANVNTTTPSASATGGTLTCAQTSTTLVGGPASGVTYSWSGPGIVGSNVIANITASVVGNYSLTTTSSVNGCSSSSVAVATVTNNLTTPTVTAGSNQIITCAAPTVTLTGNATGGSTLSWSNGVSTNTTTVGGAGIYTLTATNPANGCFVTSTVQVAPSAGTPNGNVSAASNSITCSLTSASISITSTISPLTYSWIGPGTISSPTSSATTVSSGGTYTITITNTASCSQSYQVVVPTNTTPVSASASVAPTASITCITSSVTLSSNPTGANYSYSWNGPNVISGGTSANPIVNSGGNYSVTVTNTITGCSGATGTATVFVPTNTTIPTLSLSATTVTSTCGNPNTTVIVTSNSNPNTTYTWTAPASGTINNPSVNNPSIGGSGIFTVSLTNTINGCLSAISTVTISLDVNVPTFSLSSNTATITCSVTSPSVSLTSAVSSVSYSWNPMPSSGVTTASPTFTAIGNYTCIITNTSNGCSTSAAQVAVGINTVVPSVTVTPSTSITCGSNTVAITSTVNPSTSTYTWSGPGIVGSVNISSITANTAGTYNLSITDPINGCINNSAISTVGTNTTTPTLSVASTSSVITCSISSSTLLATSSTTDIVTWTIPSGASSSNPVIAISAGDYTATVTV